MAHTNPWSDNTPLGSDAADTMDNNMRRLRVDVKERMNDVLGPNAWETQDPIVLPGLLSGFKFAKRYKYDDFQVVGAKANTPADLKALLIIRFVGETNVGGTVTINFGALFDTYDINSMDLASFVRGMAVNRTVNDVAFFYSSALVGDVLTCTVKKSDGSLFTLDEIEGHLLFWASVKPT